MDKPLVPPKKAGHKPSAERLDRVVADGVRARSERAQGYREQALKILPWICGRCQREFSYQSLHELTVHHKDHNHDNNPPDGSNWELLCRYCHDNEHSRYLDELARGDTGEAGRREEDRATHKPFAKLRELLGEKKK